ncbi:MAG: nucleotidyltransferase family protein [Flavobacteriaceae bacterium]
MGTDPSYSLILLAGGKSSRMGSPKGLLKFRNQTWLEHQVSQFHKTGIKGEVYVGIGFDAQRYLDYEFENQQWFWVQNPNPELGPFSTLQACLKKVNSDYCIIQPVDIPLPCAEEFKKLLDAREAISIAEFEKQHAHPVILRRDVYKDLLNIDAEDPEFRLDKQLKKRTKLITYVALKDSSILKNLNSPQDYNSYLVDYECTDH